MLALLIPPRIKRLPAVTIFLAGAALLLASAHAQTTPPATPPPAAPAATHTAATHHATTHHPTAHHPATATAHTAHARAVAHHRRRRRPLTAHELARSRRLQHAFVASSQLRPMAQQ